MEEKSKKKLSVCAVLSFVFALIVAGMVVAGIFFKIYLLFLFQIIFGIVALILGIIGVASSHGHVVSVIFGSLGILTPLAAVVMISIQAVNVGVDNFFRGMFDRNAIIEIIEDEARDNEDALNDFFGGLKEATKGNTKAQVKEMIQEAAEDIQREIDNY